MANFTFDKLRIITVMLFDCFMKLRLRTRRSQTVEFLCRVNSARYLLASHREMRRSVAA